MKQPRIEVEVTFYKLFLGFQSLGIFSAYQLLTMFSQEEIEELWGYQVS